MWIKVVEKSPHVPFKPSTEVECKRVLTVQMIKRVPRFTPDDSGLRRVDSIDPLKAVNDLKSGLNGDSILYTRPHDSDRSADACVYYSQSLHLDRSHYYCPNLSHIHFGSHTPVYS